MRHATEANVGEAGGVLPGFIKADIAEFDDTLDVYGVAAKLRVELPQIGKKFSF